MWKNMKWSHLQRKHFFINREEGSHCFGPGAKTCNIAAHPLGCFYVIVYHVKVRREEFHYLLIDGVFGELLQDETKVEVQKYCTEYLTYLKLLKMTVLFYICCSGSCKILRRYRSCMVPYLKIKQQLLKIYQYCMCVRYCIDSMSELNLFVPIF